MIFILLEGDLLTLTFKLRVTKLSNVNEGSTFRSVNFRGFDPPEFVSLRHPDNRTSVDVRITISEKSFVFMAFCLAGGWGKILP